MRTKLVNGIRYQNSQRYSECLLVTALNAAYRLGEPFIEPNSDEYERLVDLVRARHGAAIQIDKAYEYLKLKYIDARPSWKSVKYAMSMNRPIDIIVSTPKYGLHSIAIIGVKYDYKGKDGVGTYYVVPNMEPHTTKNGMLIKQETLAKYIVVSENVKPAIGYFRMFERHPLFPIDVS